MFADRGLRAIWLSVAVLVSLTLACPSSKEAATEKETPPVLKSYPLDSLEGVVTLSGLQFDQTTSSDGKGSVKITVDRPTTVRLFETGDLDIEDARLIYRARVRTEAVEGEVLLEMFCSFPGRGEFFSRGMERLSGTVEWVTVSTPFFLKQGENPDNVKLNLVFTGKGTAWIDDIQVLEAPLK